jgi:Putative adhesin
MYLGLGSVFGRSRSAKTTILLMMSVVFFMLSVSDVAAQKRFSKTYPAGESVRLDLLNRTGTVTVEGWNRPEINITAFLEAPAALIEPQSLSGRIVINVVRDNAGRGDVGNVNFTIRVPYYTAVDIETRIGNLNVRNIRSTLVRAHVSAEGDIELTNIIATGVAAENVSGDIFFDGEVKAGGSYRFSSMQGNINLRIPFPSSFKLVATAPSTRSINLGYFSGGGMRMVGDGRRIVGQAGDGSATIQVTNQRGTIAFIPR